MSKQTINSEQQASSRVELLTLKQDIVDILTRFRFQFKKPTTTPAFQRIALDEAIESIELLTENTKHDGYNDGVRAALESLPELVRYNEDTVPRYLKPSNGESWEPALRVEEGINLAIHETRTNLERLLK